MHLKKVFSAAALLGCLTMIFTGCSQKSSGLTPVTLSEVAHSIFYAPCMWLSKMATLPMKVWILLW